MDKYFWEQRWNSQEIGWDLGQVSPPIKLYIDQLDNKGIRILIPGAGNAYEAEYLIEKGFVNDISKGAIEAFRKRVPSFAINYILQEDFFTLTVTPYDLVIEQTFLCAIRPEMRKNYVNKMYELIKPNGLLVGVLFDRDFEGGPPFSGSRTEYEKLFSPKFEIEHMETTEHSILPRSGKELFVIMKRKP